MLISHLPVSHHAMPCRSDLCYDTHSSRRLLFASLSFVIRGVTVCFGVLFAIVGTLVVLKFIWACAGGGHDLSRPQVFGACTRMQCRFGPCNACSGASSGPVANAEYGQLKPILRRDVELAAFWCDLQHCHASEIQHVCSAILHLNRSADS